MLFFKELSRLSIPQAPKASGCHEILGHCLAKTAQTIQWCLQLCIRLWYKLNMSCQTIILIKVLYQRIKWDGTLFIYRLTQVLGALQDMDRPITRLAMIVRTLSDHWNSKIIEKFTLNTEYLFWPSWIYFRWALNAHWQNIYCVSIKIILLYKKFTNLANLCNFFWL